MLDNEVGRLPPIPSRVPAVIPHRSVRALVLIAALLETVTPVVAKPAPRPPRAEQAKAASSTKAGRKAPASTSCKEPPGTNPDLVAGLQAYGQGDWQGAVTHLSIWAA